MTTNELNNLLDNTRLSCNRDYEDCRLLPKEIRLRTIAGQEVEIIINPREVLTKDIPALERRLIAIRKAANGER